MKGLRGDLKAFLPTVLLEIGAEGWSWTPAELERLRLGAEQVAGDQWVLAGPVVLRAGYCALRFNAPWLRRPSSPTKLVASLAELPGFDEVVMAVPRKDRRLGELNSMPNGVILQAFPRSDEGVRGEVPAGWIEESLAAVESRFGAPTDFAFGLFRSSSIESAKRAGDVIERVGAGGMGCFALFFPDHGGVVALGRAGGPALQIAVAGGAAGAPEAAAHWLRDLGVRLASIVEPDYARLSIEPSGLGVISPIPRPQPDKPLSPDPDGTKQPVGTEWVPDAYWWQLIDQQLAQRIEDDVATCPITDHVTEVSFGAPAEWAPPTGWPGDPGAPPDVQPLEVLTRARASLAPLMWGSS